MLEGVGFFLVFGPLRVKRGSSFDELAETYLFTFLVFVLINGVYTRAHGHAFPISFFSLSFLPV